MITKDMYINGDVFLDYWRVIYKSINPIQGGSPVPLIRRRRMASGVSSTSIKDLIGVGIIVFSR